VVLNSGGKNNKKKREKQAGAELCQAQIKLGLAEIEVIFYLQKN
jgi:hypothetical protein